MASGPCYPETDPGICNVCKGYTTTTNYPNVTWVGMMFADQNDVNGCRRGCQSCRQEQLDSHTQSAAHLHGVRWMKAYEARFDADGALLDRLRPNRMAHGLVGDVPSLNTTRSASRVRRIPRTCAFVRGVCWENHDEFSDRPGGEGFGLDPNPGVLVPPEPSSEAEWEACDCDTEPRVHGTTEDVDCDTNFRPVPGVFRDELFFESTNYAHVDPTAPGGFPYYCRTLEDRKSQVVVARSGDLMPPVIWSAERCGINFMSHCIGKGKTGDRHCNEYDDPDQDGEGPWLDGAQHQQWNQLRLDLSNVRLGYDKDNAARGPNLLMQDEATLKFKNDIIETLKDLPNPIEGGVGRPFEQMDCQGVRTNGLDIETWGRSYNPLAPDANREFAPAFQLHKCRLRQTGAPVTIEPFVVRAGVRMHFQLIREDQTPIGLPYDGRRQRFYPHCRFHLEAHMGYRAIPAWSEAEPPRLKNSYLPEDHADFIPGWTVLEILNFDDPDYPHFLFEDESVYPRAGHNMPPIVRRAGDVEDGLRDRQPDRILYIDDGGRRFDPPSRIDWWGYMGAHSSRPSKDVWQLQADSGLEPSCCDMNLEMRHVKIGGWPMLFQTIEWENDNLPALPDEERRDNAQVYGGFVTLDFARTEDHGCRST